MSCLLEALEVLKVLEAMRCVLGTLYFAGGCGAWALFRGFEMPTSRVIMGTPAKIGGVPQLLAPPSRGSSR